MLKVKFYPRKTVVLGLLQLKIDEASNQLAEANSKLESIHGKKGLISVPGEETSWYFQKDRAEETLKQLTDLRSLVESSESQHLTAETEI